MLTATSYLVLLLALFLSSLSLPADIKNRTLHTVVTKPVRASEVVLGRIVGFTAVGTLLLAVMGAISYVFVVRGLAHTHQLTADDLQPVGRGGGRASRPCSRATPAASTSTATRCIDQPRRARPRGDGARALALADDAKRRAARPSIDLGPAEGMLLARVPDLRKTHVPRHACGQPAEKGVNVGDEWTYRSYIAGGTPAACVWTFQGITEEAFPDGLPVEMNIGVFRTYKGDIEKGVPGSLSVRNPRTGKKVEVRVFEIEGVRDRRAESSPASCRRRTGRRSTCSRISSADGAGGSLAAMRRAASSTSGAGQADMYLRARDASFALNFVKGYFGIWLQMTVVIALGVMFSTFLSGSVAMLATLGTLVGGFFSDFMFRLATGQTYGGGPFESIIRLV